MRGSPPAGVEVTHHGLRITGRRLGAAGRTIGRESGMEDPREHLVRVCKVAYDRKLLDSAGGNVTTRIGDRVYMTRSYAGGRHQWHLCAGDILELDLDGNILGGEGEFSREGAVH